jgi:hypothetical protein
MGAVSDEHGERFQRDTSLNAKYSGKWSANVLAHYSWSLVRETTGINKMQKKRKCVFNGFYCG